MTGTPLGPSAHNTWTLGPDHASLVRPVPASRPLTVEALPQRLTLDVARAAVIVVDVQNDFCTPGGWLDSIGVDISPAREPVPVLQEALPAFRARRHASLRG